MWFRKMRKSSFENVKYSVLLDTNIESHYGHLSRTCRRKESTTEEERKIKCEKWSENGAQIIFTNVLVHIVISHLVYCACTSIKCIWIGHLHCDFIRPKSNVTKMGKVLTVRFTLGENNKTNCYSKNFHVAKLKCETCVSMLPFHFTLQKPICLV